MKKRPLCLACIGLMILIFLMKLAGSSPVGGNLPAGRKSVPLCGRVRPYM